MSEFAGGVSSPAAESTRKHDDRSDSTFALLLLPRIVRICLARGIILAMTCGKSHWSMDVFFWGHPVSSYLQRIGVTGQSWTALSNFPWVDLWSAMLQHRSVIVMDACRPDSAEECAPFDYPLLCVQELSFRFFTRTFPKSTRQLLTRTSVQHLLGQLALITQDAVKKKASLALHTRAAQSCAGIF